MAAPVIARFAMTAKGTGIRVSAKRIGSLFTSRKGQGYGPSLWEYDVCIGRRHTQVAVIMPSREVRADVRHLVDRLAQGR